MYRAEFLSRWLPAWLDTDSFYAFGLFMIGFLIYLFKANFKLLIKLKNKPAWHGLVFTAIGFLIYVIGMRTDVSYMISLSLVLFINGLILCFWGVQVFKKTFIPLSLFAFTLPIFPLHRLTLPLQSFSTYLSSGLLNISGVSALSEGNIINIMGRRISVVAGCSGVKSLFNLFFISIIYSYFVNINFKKKLFLIISTLPFAIILNVARITLVGLYVLYRGYEGSAEFHDISGTILIGLSVGLMMFIFKNLQEESNEI